MTLSTHLFQTLEEANQEIGRLEKVNAKLLEALKVALLDHQIIEPHHEDLCRLCEKMKAAIAEGVQLERRGSREN